VIVNADARGYEEASCAPVWVDVVAGEVHRYCSARRIHAGIRFT
jgi:hypothetical protein